MSYICIKCLEEPWNAQYDGGLIQNPEFNDGIQGWTTFGQGKIEQRTTQDGNKFIVAFNRTQPSDSLSQKIQLEKGKLYAFSGNHFSVITTLMLQTLPFLNCD